ncbi:cache domain-containing protein [Candidatus Nitrosotenuis cloacae]|uniref:cache domain-containing protein n=1 Tax=Candidatus Nitrosotenuis cloacae TaxID=1603555 RepID=UPI00227F099A|nr:cache domain-containing protein [Candidatus Nitrosotenuis cloacae]
MGIPVTLDKKLVTLVILVSMTGIGVTIGFSFHYSNIIIEERVMDQLTSESAIRGDSIKNTFSSKLQQIQVIGTDPMIRNLINEFNSIQDEAIAHSWISEKRIDFLIQIQAFESSIGGANDLENVEIVGKDGMRLFALINTKTAKNYLEDPIFQHGIKEPLVEIMRGGNGQRLLIAATPIFDKPDQDAIGVAIVTMNAESLDQILLNRLGLGKTGESYLVNADGKMISESRFIENAPFNQVVDTIPIRKCFVEGQTNHGQYPDYRGRMVFGASNCMKDIGLVLLVEIDDTEVFEPAYNLQQKIVILGITITGIVGVVAYFLSKLISKPLIKLKNAANVLADGNFDVRTNISTNDEIGQLSHAFDQMAEKIQDSLIKIKEREDTIKQQKDVLLQFSQHSSNYCVCFVDIVGSTKLTSKLTDLQTSKFYSIFLNSLATVISQNGGVVVKNIGDALLYYFPKTDSDEIGPFAEMLKCNRKVIEARENINKVLEAENLPSISYRISANFGPVRVAIIATSSIDDIFGSTVNICSKINSLAQPNTLVIGEPLYDKVKEIKEYKFEKIADYGIDADNKLPVYSVTPKG